MAEVANPAINELVDSLQEDLLEVRERFAKATVGLADDGLRWSPAPQRWSIAQIIEHLNLVGYALAPRMEEALPQLALKGRAQSPPRYSLIERLFIRMVSPNPPFHVPVPPLYVPPLTPADPQESMVRFLALQATLDRWLRESRGLNLNAIRISSPANRALKMTAGAWLHATIAHEQYHLLQVEALRRRPDLPIT